MQHRQYATFARRLIVFVGLLGIPSLFAYVWNLSLNKPSAPFLREHGHGIAYFAWGASAYFAHLGVWLVVRDRLFASAIGWLRAIVYFTAAIYGYMCYSTLQDWLVGYIPAMPVPGTKVKHYAWAVLMSEQVLTFAWVFWPMLFLFRRRLAERPLAATDIPRPNVRFFLAWTAMAAVMLVGLRLVVQYGKPLNLYVTSQPIQIVLKDYVARLPLTIVQAISVASMMIAFADKPAHWLWSVPMATALVFGGQWLVVWTSEWLVAPGLYGVMSGPLKDSLPYFAGNAFITVVVFAVARLTGLTFQPAQELRSNPLVLASADGASPGQCSPP